MKKCNMPSPGTVSLLWFCTA